MTFALRSSAPSLKMRALTSFFFLASLAVPLASLTLIVLVSPAFSV